MVVTLSERSESKGLAVQAPNDNDHGEIPRRGRSRSSE